MQDKLFSFRQTIGKNVRDKRKRKGLTQAQLAELVKLSPQSISTVENGMGFIRMDNYFRIADALNVSIPELFHPFSDPDDESFANAVTRLFDDCSTSEQSRLFNILVEIKMLMRG